MRVFDLLLRRNFESYALSKGYYNTCRRLYQNNDIYLSKRRSVERLSNSLRVGISPSQTSQKQQCRQLRLRDQKLHLHHFDCTTRLAPQRRAETARLSFISQFYHKDRLQSLFQTYRSRPGLLTVLLSLLHHCSSRMAKLNLLRHFLLCLHHLSPSRLVRQSSMIPREHSLRSFPKYQRPI